MVLAIDGRLTKAVATPATVQPMLWLDQCTPSESKNFDWSIATWFDGGHCMGIKQEEEPNGQ